MAQNSPWPNLAIQNYKRALGRHRELVRTPARKQPDEVTGALARFLVVRSAGFVEIVTEECVTAYISSKAAPGVVRYSKSWLGKGRNASPGALVELVGRFDAAWKSDIERLFNDDDEYLKRELGLMIDRRNKIAHGRGENVSGRKALEFVEVAYTVTEWFVHQFDPR